MEKLNLGHTYLYNLEKYFKFPSDVTEKVTMNAIRMVQWIDRELQKITLTFSCYKGCSHCCSLNIDTTMHERILILHLLFFLGDEVFKSVKESIQNWGYVFKNQFQKFNLLCSKEDKNKFIQEYENNNIDCPFLLNNECIIYTVRPIVCRTYFSLSAPEMCKTRNNVIEISTRANSVKNIGMDTLSFFDIDFFGESQLMPLGLYFYKKLPQIDHVKSSIKERI